MRILILCLAAGLFLTAYPVAAQTAGTRTLIVAAFGMETQEVRVTVVANERTWLEVRLVDDGMTCRSQPLPSLPPIDPDTTGTISILSRQDMTGY